MRNDMRIAKMISVLCMVWGVFALGCGNSNNDQQQMANNVQQQVPFNTVQKGGVSPYANNPPQIIIIRNEGEWASFWNLLYTNYSPKPALPSISFLDAVVISAVDSAHSSGGYSITIGRIDITSSGATVYVSQESLGQGCGAVTASITQPYHIVTAPAFSGAATVELSQSVTNCGP
jgi:hypothetical protein